MSVGGVSMYIFGDGVAQKLKSNKSNKKVCMLEGSHPPFRTIS